MTVETLKPSSPTARLPKEVIDVLRDQVFGFDTFFVTGQEPYEVRMQDAVWIVCLDLEIVILGPRCVISQARNRRTENIDQR